MAVITTGALPRVSWSGTELFPTLRLLRLRMTTKATTLVPSNNTKPTDEALRVAWRHTVLQGQPALTSLFARKLLLELLRFLYRFLVDCFLYAKTFKDH